MENQSFSFDIETPESGRSLPITGKPFALIMAELASENNGFVRIVR